VKLLSIKEAQERFPSVCDAALAGEEIQVRHPNGSLLKLMSVPNAYDKVVPAMDDLALAYEDGEWAVFENHCADSSDCWLRGQYGPTIFRWRDPTRV
jgi:hypothetical protein